MPDQRLFTDPRSTRAVGRPPSHPAPGTAARPAWQVVPAAPAVPAILATRLADGAVRCDLCAHRCLIREGRVGICGVRENRDGTLVSLVHGRLASFALDPIEKKPLFHVLPGTTAYSIATPGCNFHCRHCQNWEISQAPRLGLPIGGTPTTPFTPNGIVERALAAGARSVAYTYVEPTVFAELLIDTARLAHEAGLLNLMVTNGYQTREALDLLAPLVDAANVDLKSFSDAFYRRICGARLAPVLQALTGMRERGIWVEVTTLVIPGLNDGAAELAALSRWIVRALGEETPWHVSRFYPAYRMLDRPRTPAGTIQRAVDLGREAGLRHVYPGNLGALPDETRCAGCGTLLIRRIGYSVVANGLADGACPWCRRPLPGIWADGGARGAA